MAQDAPGMKGVRSRNKDGTLHRKRGDTHVGTIEKEYGVDLDARSDAHLKSVLKRDGAASQDELLREHRD